MTQPLNLTAETVTEAAAGPQPTLVTSTAINCLEVDGAWQALCRHDGANVTAKRAASCLVVPAPGDTVLLSLVDGTAFVLAVLDRAEPSQPVQLAPGAHVTLSAETVTVEAASELQFRAPTVGITSEFLRLVGKRAAHVFSRVTEALGHLTTSADRIDTAATLVSTKAKDRTTVVSETETEKLGTLMQTVDGTATLTSHSTVILAQEDVRMDGKRIITG
ncbi:MAG: DUF3540 domain-containing protein [Pseudomonadota bacterium]